MALKSGLDMDESLSLSEKLTDYEPLKMKIQQCQEQMKEEGHQHTTECKRDGEHDNERITQRLKLGGHYNKYQNDNQYSQCT